jgi:hypothetical protein
MHQQYNDHYQLIISALKVIQIMVCDWLTFFLTLSFTQTAHEN